MQCKFCYNSMYLDDRCTVKSGEVLDSYNCAFCGAVYDVHIGKKGIKLRESWFNPNADNYKVFKAVLLELFKRLSPREELRILIEKTETIDELIAIIRNNERSLSEKEVEVFKSYIKEQIKNNSNYGEKTQKAFLIILSSNKHPLEMYISILNYANTHDLSL